MPADAPDTLAARFAGKRILITGGLGFIGSNLARRLVSSAAKLVLVDSLIPEYGGNLFNVADLRDVVQINISDVRDVHSMRYLVRGVDYVFNLAGQTSHMDSMTDPYADLDINCRAQLSILEACRANNPGARLVYASTRQIYGRPQYLPVDEKHPLNPVDVNGINKMAGERYHVLYSDVYGIRSSCLRLTNTYGPGMRVKDARQTFLGIWVRLLVQQKPFEVWDGEQLRDFTYVDDVVDALLAAATTDRAVGQIFNLGGNEVVSLVDLARLLVETNGGGQFESKAFPADRKRIDIGDYYSDYKRAQEILGWTPAVKLSAGLRRTVAYYREHLEKYL